MTLMQPIKLSNFAANNEKIVEKMSKTHFVTVLLSVLLVTGCSEKKIQEKTSLVKVRTITLTPSLVGGMQTYSGTAEEMNGSIISFNGGGTIERLYVSEGQMVRKGQLIATVNAESVKNSYNAALASRRQAEDAYGRMKQLHDKGSLPEIKWVEVQSKLQQAVSAEQIALKGLHDCKLYAPVSGYVSKKMADAGQNVAPGGPVVKLVEINKVKVKVPVPEEEISAFRTAGTVSINVPALGGRTFTGRIIEKGVSADPLSRTYDVSALVDNAGHQILPGMICELYADMGGEKQDLTLPADIIQLSFDNKAFVWTNVNGKAHKVNVEVGGNAGENVLIRGGLSLGDKVIVEGQQKVSEGMAVKE